MIAAAAAPARATGRSGGWCSAALAGFPAAARDSIYIMAVGRDIEGPR